MAYSCASSDVGTDYVDSTVPQLIADLLSGLTIEAPIYLATVAAIDRRAVLGDLLVALTCVRRS